MESFDYASPDKIDDALALLARTPGARVLAGGCQLLLEPGRSQLAATLLVDLRRIGDLAGIEIASDGSVQIGAMTTLAQVAADPAIRTWQPALLEALLSMGDAQLRNRATLAGALLTREPAADLPAVMLALAARVTLQSTRGARTVEADALFATEGSCPAPDELLTRILLASPAAGTGTAYEKQRDRGNPQPLFGIAACVRIENGDVTHCRVARTGLVEHPGRAQAVEAALLGTRASPAQIEAAARRASEGAAARSDATASADYRRALAEILTRRALVRAVAAADERA
jgi:aerobic carbon-monoxide dehydrogenase medium subunit